MCKNDHNYVICFVESHTYIILNISNCVHTQTNSEFYSRLWCVSLGCLFLNFLKNLTKHDMRLESRQIFESGVRSDSFSLVMVVV